MACGGDIVGLTVGKYGEIRQITIMVKQEVKFDGTFRLTKVSSWEQTKAKIDGGRVQTEEFILETKLFLFTGTLLATDIQDMEEQSNKKFIGTMRIRIGKSALGRSLAQTQMIELTTSDGQTITNLT
jgi:hypothetical protein